MSNETPSVEAPIQTQPEERPRTIGHYQLGKTIGEGTFGKVKLSTHTLTGEKVAIKILEKDKITDVNDVERVAREIHILKLIRHPNIIQLYEIIETPKQLYLVMEYCNGGELFEYIVANNRIKEKEACRFFQQIISGVEYIHKLNVVHRDLKPENLLLDFNMNIKIVDFGLSNTYKDGQTLKTACGSPCYAAPEMIAGKRYNGLQVDIWSCGVILFAMLCGYLPFEDANTSNLYKKILNGDYQIPKFVSSEARDMIKGILNTDPQKRFTIEDIRTHPWYNMVGNQRESDGIIIGLNNVPVDYHILQKLESFNFSTSYAKKCIEANKHNHVTTSYYLLLQEYLRNGGMSDADMSSPHFIATLLHPPQTEEGSSSSLPKRKTSEPSPITADSTAVTTPTHKLNQSLTPTLQADLKALIAKGKPQIKVHNGLNLNNLDTSLTKEFDRTILSNVSSAKNKPNPMSLSAKKEKSDPVPVRKEDVTSKRPFFSPSPKNEREGNPYHQRHTSNPDAVDPHFAREREIFGGEPRKEQEYAVSANYTPRQIAAAEKPVNPVGGRRAAAAVQSERYHTEGCQNVITEAEVIYESLSSSRRTPDKTAGASSTQYTENPVKSRKSPSPKPNGHSVTQSISGAKNIYLAYKNLTQKQGVNTKSPRKTKEKSLNASLDRTLKDNYVGAALQKKSFISPRVSQEKQTPYITLSNRKAMVSTSQGFVPGALKEKSNNTSNTNIVDRLSSHTPGMKIYKGPFHLNSVTSKNPKYLMSEITRTLENNKIHFRNITKYSLKCEKDTNKFEVEINCLQNHENVYIVKFSKQSGDITKSNELCSLIYRGLDL